MNGPDVHHERLLKVIEVAEILNISRAFAYKLIQTGDLPFVSIGSSKRVRQEDLKAFIQLNRSQATQTKV